MGKVMVININECTGCYNCVIACKDEHVDNDWLPWTKAQPPMGHFWIKVLSIERGSQPFVKVTYIPIMCQHCDNAPCIKVCPVNAIKRREDGLVWIDQNTCTGCGLCINACPYGAIYINDKLKVAQKCTWCAHLIDRGQNPRCVDACPHDAIIFGDENDPRIKELLTKAEVYHPEYQTRPRVYYIGLPKPFIAGTTIDPDSNEVVIGARVLIKDLYTDEEYETFTDEFGNFMIKDLKWDHKYEVIISKDGFEKRVLIVTTVSDVVLKEVRIKRVK